MGFLLYECILIVPEVIQFLLILDKLAINILSPPPPAEVSKVLWGVCLEMELRCRP
jgi:hypothetical protein